MCGVPLCTTDRDGQWRESEWDGVRESVDIIII